jgi:protein-L-isoaspartate(D-aspartate) O-methyltransferase
MTIDYAQAREAMVECQIRPWEVSDPRVLETQSSLYRERFVPPDWRALAYADLELPLGHGQRMMKPVIEGRVLQALALQAEEDVLEIGAGSGFLSACLGTLAREVTSLEIVPKLADSARANLETAGVHNARVETADVFAWDTERRFDAICVTAACAEPPLQFLRWLRPGGRMFAAHGRSPAMEAALWRVNGTPVESLFETDLPYLVGAKPVPRFVF